MKKINDRKHGFEKQKRLKIFFASLLLSMCFQKISIISLGVFSFKLFHLIALLGVIPLVKRKTIKNPNKKLVLFVLLIILLSLILYIFTKFNSLVLNYAFGVLILFEVYNLGTDIKRGDWLKIGRFAALVLVGLTFIRFIVNANIIVAYLAKGGVNGHIGTIIGTYFEGGSNLEASWVALFGFFFLGDRKSIWYLICSIVISIIFSSRAALIIDALLLLAILFWQKEQKTTIHAKRIIIVCLLLVLSSVVLSRFGLLDYILGRFDSVGQKEDMGSEGRLNMWRYVFEALLRNPLGYGLGNAIDGIKLVGGHSYRENNVHNIYMQMLLDTGIIGFSMFMITIISFIKKNFAKVFRNQFVAFILAYLIAGFVQFRGGDAILFHVIGLFLLTRNYYDECMKNKTPNLEKKND